MREPTGGDASFTAEYPEPGSEPPQGNAMPEQAPPPTDPASVALTGKLLSTTPDAQAAHAEKVRDDGAGEPLPVVAGYEILSVLGHGGMGVVYRARQLSLDRVVALKMIRGGLVLGGQHLHRFENEARAVARLRHPNIVQIYETGAHLGQPYLVLELVDGGNLAQFLARQPVTPREAAFLVETLARAMHYAHQQGIVHRDLKPANVLLQAEADGSDADGLVAPKISDFGLAKHLEAEVFLTHTPSGIFLGTPSYMAPEQAWGKSQDIGPASDVYALGAILYEAVAGKPPFLADRLLDVMEQVRHSEPVTLSRLNPRCPRDLETICLKCLQKEPGRRYASALELAEDLRRFQSGEPIRARPISAWERGWKWARRRPTTAALTAVSVAAVMLLVGFFVVVQHLRAQQEAEAWQHDQEYQEELAKQQREAEDRRQVELEKSAKKLRDEQEARQRAEEDRRRQDKKAEEARQDTRRAQEDLRKEQESAYFTHIAQANRALSGNDRARAARLLEGCPPELRRWEWQFLKGACEGRTARVLPGLASATALAFSPDRDRLAVGTNTGVVQFWDTTTGRLVKEFQAGEGVILGLAFHSEGEQLATLGWRANLPPPKEQSPKKPSPQDGVRRPRQMEGLLAMHAPGRPEVDWTSARSAPKLVLLEDVKDKKGGPGSEARPQATCEVKLWLVTTGKMVRTFPTTNLLVNAVAFSPDGTLLAAGGFTVPKPSPVQAESTQAASFEPAKTASRSAGGVVKIWNARTGQELHSLTMDGPANGTVFHPQGDKFAVACGDGIASIWDSRTGKELLALRGHVGPVLSLAYHPKGGQLVTSGEDESVRSWEAASGKLLFLGREHTGKVTCLAFSRDGARLATASQDRTVRVWDTVTGQLVLTLRGHAGAVRSVAFSSDGKRLASAGEDGAVVLWDGPHTLLPAQPAAPKAKD